ncbi:pyridoxamine 5'-phosphate oxidase family protein [Actinomadura scrupuli]|uniref:pyridoxamine 5'-phosphate oxidase family protein n=1 Tax=Actinomadura scrupuli TaxID=559629 RepID=UPI003D98D7F3
MSGTSPVRHALSKAAPDSIDPSDIDPSGTDDTDAGLSGTGLSGTERTRHRRLRENGRTDRAELFAVLRAGFVCHLGVVVDGAPMVVPTVYGFDATHLYFHGSVASRSLVAVGDPAGGPARETGQKAEQEVEQETVREAQREIPLVCVTVTHVDGLVLARSVFEHGVNYRSAMIYGRPRVLGGADKLEGLRIVTEHCAPGQWDYARRPSRKELAATTLLALPLDEASVKISSGPPQDGDGPDAELGLWAGVVPLTSGRGAPEPDPALPPGIGVPAHITALGGPALPASSRP